MPAFVDYLEKGDVTLIELLSSVPIESKRLGSEGDPGKLLKDDNLLSVFSGYRTKKVSNVYQH